jgi:hypothetical protein
MTNMSHWRKYSAQVLENVKEGLLHKACADLGVTFDTNIKQVGNSYGEGAKVDAGLQQNGRNLPLGFLFKTEGGKTKLTLEGDFWGTGLDEHSFIDRLSQSYQKHNIIEQATNQGWFFDVNNVDKDGNVVLEAYQWA